MDEMIKKKNQNNVLGAIQVFFDVMFLLTILGVLKLPIKVFNVTSIIASLLIIFFEVIFIAILIIASRRNSFVSANKLLNNKSKLRNQFSDGLNFLDKEIWLAIIVIKLTGFADVNNAVVTLVIIDFIVTLLFMLTTKYFLSTTLKISTKGYYIITSSRKEETKEYLALLDQLNMTPAPLESDYVDKNSYIQDLKDYKKSIKKEKSILDKYFYSIIETI